jgi:quercetin dioxygenase-like cupin family protein
MMELSAKVSKLAGLVSVQEGAVISREIIKKSKGTVTVFAFDKGQGLSEHTAPFDALVTCLEGEMEVKISGEPSVLKAGEMIIMPADKPHSLNAITPFKMLLVLIRE